MSLIFLYFQILRNFIRGLPVKNTENAKFHGKIWVSKDLHEFLQKNRDILKWPFLRLDIGLQSPVVAPFRFSKINISASGSPRGSIFLKSALLKFIFTILSEKFILY